MNIRDVIYLNKLADTAQYLAARCDMRDDVYMYHRQATAGAEAMNVANFSIRQRTAVDLDNAMILLLDLECKRYNKQQAEAWTRDGVLTPRGNLEFEESLNDINHAQFRITVTERENVWVCLVKRIEERGPDRVVAIPKEPVRGSHFGRCTCGVDKRDAAPFEHMAAVAVSFRLSGVTRHNMMPYWWMRAQWHKQLPQELLAITNINISTIIEDSQPDHNLCYCPDWTANKKSGRPQKYARKRSVLKRATGNKGQKRATGLKRARRYCQICGKYSHVTNECWNLESNAHKHPGYAAPIIEERYAAPIGEEGTADASGKSDEDEQSDEDGQTDEGSEGTAYE